MQTHIFNKEEGSWFIDLPEYIEQGGSKADLIMVEGADTMLDIIANGNDTITVSIDEEPFSEADELELLELCDPIVGGGYYLMRLIREKK